MDSNTPPPSSLTCPICSKLYCLPVTLLCCGLTSCEQCGLGLWRRSEPCGCGVVLRGREDMLYNEDIKFELERYHQEMKSKQKLLECISLLPTIVSAPASVISSPSTKKPKRVWKRFRSVGELARRRQRKLDYLSKMLPTGPNSMSMKRYCSSSDENSGEERRKKIICKADNKLFDPSTTSSEYTEVLLEQKNVDKLPDIKTDIDDNKNYVEKKEIKPLLQFGNSNGKEETRFDDNANGRNVFLPSSTKKFHNILVFIDLQKMSIYNEDSPISQVGCFFDEESLRYPSEQNQDLQFQSFYAVTAPRLQEYNERSDLWSKYFLFDEFYYRHPDSMIRCCPEKSVLELLCQYLAKIKLRYREVNICVAQNKNIKELMTREYLHN